MGLVNENLMNSEPSLGSLSLKSQGYLQRSSSWNDYITHTMDVWYRWDEDNVANFAWYVTKWYLNPARILHGGATMTFIDHCMGALCYHTTNGAVSHTLQLSTQFIHPARANRWLFCEARHLSGTKSNLMVEADVWIQSIESMDTTFKKRMIAKSHGTFTTSKP